MKNIFRISVILLTILFSSCVHQWPESLPIPVKLKLEFDGSMHPFDTLLVDTKTPTDDDHDLRYVVEAYRNKEAGGYYRDAIVREVFTKDIVSTLDNEIMLSVPDEGSYTFKVWVDYVGQGEADHKYYNPEKFNEIMMHEHQGNTDLRDAYVGSVELYAKRYGSQVPVEEGTLHLYRPVAKYEFISSDLVEFIERETRMLNTRADLVQRGTKELDLNDYTVKIYYTGFMPSAFNMHSDRPNDSKTGVYFESKIQKINDKEAKLGFDYVLANPGEASVVTAVAIYDAEGIEIAATTDIHIPLRRGMLTTVKGSFLMKESSGGVSINPDFDGEFNIIL